MGGGLRKKEGGGVFEGGVETPMHTMVMILQYHCLSRHFFSIFQTNLWEYQDFLFQICVYATIANL